MQAKDVMTTEVITAKPNDTVADLAKTLLEHGISAVPVVEGEKVVGIVSEGDLVSRAEIGTDTHHRSWWLQLFTSDSKLTNEYVKSHAHKVSDVMHKDVITVSEDTDLSEVAHLLEKNRIKRVPVVKGGKLVGVVSRADILQKLAAHQENPMEAAPDDSALRDKVNHEIRSHGWSNPISFSVTVTDGVVDLWGIYRTSDERDAARVAAESVKGVKKVQDHRKQMRMPYTG